MAKLKETARITRRNKSNRVDNKLAKKVAKEEALYDMSRSGIDYRKTKKSFLARLFGL